MADVASLAQAQAPPHHHTDTGSIGSVTGGTPFGAEPVFEMVPNPSFSFPIAPNASSLSTQATATASSRRRPMSMQLGVSGTGSGRSAAHSRATSALPSFSFNSVDTTGLQRSNTPPETPVEDAPVTPKRGHRRGGSEFVGGDSRLGMDNAISSSPTKTDAGPMNFPTNELPIPRRRGHQHRRSQALSSHDLSSIKYPAHESEPRLSSSLPSTPLAHPSEARSPLLDRSVSETQTTVAGADRDGSPVRLSPRSGPRVGFAQEVEYIPRPLSTISSGSEGSKGHSLSSSIDMISMSPGSPSRSLRRSLDVHTAMESINEAASRPRTSSEISREQTKEEGQWLKSKSLDVANGAPVTLPDATSPALTFVDPDRPATPSPVHRRNRSHGHGLGLDRRKSEPSISSVAGGTSHMSALSLQYHPASDDQESEDSEIARKSSTRKIKDWALAKLHRRSRDYSSRSGGPYAVRTHHEVLAAAAVGENAPLHPAPPAAMAETDLDAVFDTSEELTAGGSDEAARVAFHTPIFEPVPEAQLDSSDNTMIDLDAALGPMPAPPAGNSYRKSLHSFRTSSGPSAYLHRRAESAPTLTPFDFGRNGTPSSSAMADVFEEEEEEDDVVDSISPGARQTGGMGISIVDADHSAPHGLRIHRGGWTPDRPSTSHGSLSFSSMLSTPANDRRSSSIIEDTIIEESAPTEMAIEAVQIVEDHEEPRASSLTKYSDSSETSTILVHVQEPSLSIMTPDTLHTSAFSSPDMQRRQGSFDTSRLGTSASSIADNRTTSSCMTGEASHDLRGSVDDVPSLTSSRSTMTSTAHANTSRRDFGTEQRTPSGSSSNLAPDAAYERRRHRSSIASFSQLMGQSFGPKPKASEEFRPATANAALKPKKEHRLKKLMFWRSKSVGSGITLNGRLHKEQPAV